MLAKLLLLLFHSFVNHSSIQPSGGHFKSLGYDAEGNELLYYFKSQPEILHTNPPSNAPSMHPTAFDPTISPTISPTNHPTHSPTQNPTPTKLKPCLRNTTRNYSIFDAKSNITDNNFISKIQKCNTKLAKTIKSTDVPTKPFIKQRNPKIIAKIRQRQQRKLRKDDKNENFTPIITIYWSDSSVISPKNSREQTVSILKDSKNSF